MNLIAPANNIKGVETLWQFVENLHNDPDVLEDEHKEMRERGQFIFSLIRVISISANLQLNPSYF